METSLSRLQLVTCWATLQCKQYGLTKPSEYLIRRSRAAVQQLTDREVKSFLRDMKEQAV